jgi:hypothetical protein
MGSQGTNWIDARQDATPKDKKTSNHVQNPFLSAKTLVEWLLTVQTGLLCVASAPVQCHVMFPPTAFQTFHSQLSFSSLLHNQFN